VGKMKINIRNIKRNKGGVRKIENLKIKEKA